MAFLWFSSIYLKCLKDFARSISTCEIDTADTEGLSNLLSCVVNY